MNLGRPRHEGPTARYCLLLFIAGISGCKLLALLATRAIDPNMPPLSPFSLLLSWEWPIAGAWCAFVVSGVWRRLKDDELYGYVEAWYVALSTLDSIYLWWTASFTAYQLARVEKVLPGGWPVLVLPAVALWAVLLTAQAVLLAVVYFRGGEPKPRGPLPTIPDIKRALGGQHV